MVGIQTSEQISNITIFIKMYLGLKIIIPVRLNFQRLPQLEVTLKRR